ncbi:MAG TPA: AgmX/PglI C-terminal domain-containing protein [Polyangiaceae bacterium]|nr:AgmX/PglI C-terminal domain-containing protein [Polyangiaceae bacterium]
MPPRTRTLGAAVAGLAPLAALVGTLLGCASKPPIACPASGGPPWTELTSRHLVVKTDVAPERARELVADFERLYDVLGRFTGQKEEGAGAGEKVTAVVFEDHAEFEAFEGRESARAAYFTERPLLDVEPEPTLVMSRGEDERGREIFLHELTHRFVHDRYPEAPPWLSEGFAMFYETMRFDGGRWVLGAQWRRPVDAIFWTEAVGAPLGGMVELQNVPSVESLVSADRSKFYGEPFDAYTKAAWAGAYYMGAFRFVHMLMNGPHPAYRARFTSYLGALARGAKPTKALYEAFAGVDLRAIERDYRAYLGAAEIPVRKMDLGPPAPPPHVSSRPMSDAEVHLLWSGLRPEGDAFAPAVEADLREALARDPSSHEARRRRALLLARGRRFPEASAEIGAALALRPDDPKNLLGRLKIESASDPEGLACGAARPEVDAIVERLRRTAVTGAGLQMVAWYQQRHGRTDAGLAAAEAAVRKSPRCWSCQDTYSLLLLQKGDVPGALAANARAQALLPEDSDNDAPSLHGRLIAALNASPSSADRPSTESLEAVLRYGAGGLKCCYALGRRADANLKGQILLRVKVQPDGSVQSADVAESTLGSPDVESCMAREAAMLHFAPFQGDAFMFQRPLRFDPTALERPRSGRGGN